jgi:septal ring factor EnvC (AmiA/AmiB activator)
MWVCSALRDAKGGPSFAFMNRYLVVMMLVCVMRMPVVAAGQDSNKEDLDERFGRITTAVEDAVAKNVLLEKRIEQLNTELRSLREEQARNASSTVIQDDMRKLADAIKEVDRKREADKQLIIEKLEAIARSVAEVRSAPPAPVNVASAPSISDKCYEYEVKAGDRLMAIIDAYNATFREKKLRQVTLKQVEDANPGINPHRLKKGQKVLIPVPPPVE